MGASTPRIPWSSTARPSASKYTRDNVYWLTYGTGDRPAHGGPRRHAGDGGDAGLLPRAAHVEQNKFYIPKAPGDENLERWLWDYVYPPSRPSWSHTFSLAAPYTRAGTATLKVAMLGYLQNPINPDHHTRLYLNGTLVDDATWDGITWHVSEIAVPQSLLVAGNNTLSVVCPNDTGVGYDVVYVDWAELEFANTFLAEGDVLSFTYEAAGTWKYQVDGFTTDQVAVYDVTDPSGGGAANGDRRDLVPIRVRGAVPGHGHGAGQLLGDGRHGLPDRAGDRGGHAVEPAKHCEWRGLPPDHPPGLLRTQARPCATSGPRRGCARCWWTCRTCTTSSAMASQGPARSTTSWPTPTGTGRRPRRRTCVLVGDGHYDPKNYLGYGRASYMPPYLAPVDPWIGETAADNRYVTLVGADTLPDMMLGRLAVNSSAEASALVNKIMAYEQSPAPGDWSSRCWRWPTTPTARGTLPGCRTICSAAYLPVPYQAEKVYYGVTHTTAAAARAAILAGINAGKLIVNYIGHAEHTQLGGRGSVHDGRRPLAPERRQAAGDAAHDLLRRLLPLSRIPLPLGRRPWPR